MAGAVPVYCICRQPYDVSRFMIECDICKDWFHGSCVKVEEHYAFDIDLYHCPNCAVLHGPSLMKQHRNWHRHDYTEPDDGTKPVQAGTETFIKQLRGRSFPSADEVVLKMQGCQLTQKYLEKNGFDAPIMVPKLDGLGLVLPPSEFSVRDVESYVGGEKIIDVIDVARQADSKMKLCDFVEYFRNPDRPKVLNVISLEFSDTKMSKLVRVPDIAKHLSWVENYWPDDSVFPKPFVQKYCLMGVKDSYTDFHIDFGGTSVWYHVLWGEKVFYLIKPSYENLALYESWSSSVNQSEVFFGDLVKKCYKCVVRPGNTLFIPTGWIHGVLTSQDCMAFGGNFLHNLNIGMQLRCYEMEKRLKTPDLFKFPYFEAICWFVAKSLLETLKELREDCCTPPLYLVLGVKALIDALKCWMKKEVVSEHAFEIPDNIRPGHLIKELTKEVRYVELELIETLGVYLQYNVVAVERELVEREIEEDLCESRLSEKFNKDLQPSSTVPEWKSRNNHLRLLLSNGRIIRSDETRTLADRSLFTVDSEDEDDRARTRKMKDVKEEQESSESESEDTIEIQKPLNLFFESVKSELRNGTSEYSDISDSDDCTKQKREFSEEDSESTDEEREATSDSQEKGAGALMDLYRASQKLFKAESPSDSDRPTSPSTEEAIQGMLSMASLHCSTSIPNQKQSTNRMHFPWQLEDLPCTQERARSRSPEIECHTEREIVDEEQEQSISSWIRFQNDLTPQVGVHFSVISSVKVQKHIEKYESSNLSASVLEGTAVEQGSNRDSGNWSGSDCHSNKYCFESSTVQVCQLSDGSLSPEQSYIDTSLSPPLHPTKRPASNPPPVSNQATKGKRPKKGMATAKQRLGKILKLNRHRHARFFV
ncbi:lysine-specific demethylase 7A [Protopterus annectens]|uniref:lysine-specific demethylase 7A n=1 Tax=Protopterus annectens TaxID=7888 RepID=UPI001CFB8F0C|nr:lysine-specific demethylase 7A [Protopterus annectens]